MYIKNRRNGSSKFVVRLIDKNRHDNYLKTMFILAKNRGKL